MRGKNSTKEAASVDKKFRRFHHDLDYAYMNIDVDSRKQPIKLGVALRALRLARNWTLNDFERASGGKIKAVVIGSYERGSRSITVSKLQAITEIYGVPITAVLSVGHENPYTVSDNVIIDLRRLRIVLETRTSRNLENLNTFITGIVNTRKDYNGEILSLRASDLEFLAIMASSNAERMIAEFANLKIFFTSKD